MRGCRNHGSSPRPSPPASRVTDVVADKTKTADLKIRNLGNGRFEVTDRHGKHQVTEGVPIIATDSLGPWIDQAVNSRPPRSRF